MQDNFDFQAYIFIIKTSSNNAKIASSKFRINLPTDFLKFYMVEFHKKWSDISEYQLQSSMSKLCLNTIKGLSMEPAKLSICCNSKWVNSANFNFIFSYLSSAELVILYIVLRSAIWPCYVEHKKHIYIERKYTKTEAGACSMYIHWASKR